MVVDGFSAPTRRRWLTLSAGYVTTTAGGTETYVQRFNRALLKRGLDAHACFYATGPVRASVDGVACHAMPTPKDERSRRERFAQRSLGLKDFELLLRQLAPDVVHVNDFGAFVSLEHLAAAKAAGAKVVATYHSSGFSCPANALLYRGRGLCDGELRVGRCTRCCLEIAGVPSPAAALLGSVGLSALTPLVPPFARHPLERRRGTVDYVARWHAWMENCDVVTYAADWIRDLLLRNHVSASKLVQLPLPPPVIHDVVARPDFWDWAPPDAFRLLFAGRISDIKGAHLLVEAVQKHLSSENLALCLMGSAPTPSFGEAIERAISTDERIRWYSPQEEAACLGAHLACDAVVVPSVSPETGPYSVLEAQWLGATIIGSDRAGIRQRLRGYRRGVVFEPGNARALAEAIKQAIALPRQKCQFDTEGYTMRFDEALTAMLSRL